VPPHATRADGEPSRATSATPTAAAVAAAPASEPNRPFPRCQPIIAPNFPFAASLD
jgi:hypothetical protein